MINSPSLTAVSTDQASRLRPLFEAEGLPAWNASIGAVLEGTCPGRAWTDSLDQPRAAFLITPEGSYLAGDADTPAFGEALRALITSTIFHPEGYHFTALLVTCAADWLPVWAAAAPYPLVTLQRQHYLCTRLAFDWSSAALPDGFSVRQIDDSLLESLEIDWPDHVHEWITNNWCKRSNFLVHGFGFVTLHAWPDGQRVASWSLADAVSAAGESVYGEIGIHTLADYRQRGLATITAAAAVDHALLYGWQSVGWHCMTDNIASARTAQAVGFRHTRDYTSSLCVVPRGTHDRSEQNNNAHSDAQEEFRSE